MLASTSLVSQLTPIQSLSLKLALFEDVLNAENVNAGKRMQKKGIKEESLSVSVSIGSYFYLHFSCN